MAERKRRSGETIHPQKLRSLPVANSAVAVPGFPASVMPRPVFLVWSCSRLYGVNSIALYLAMTFAKEKWILRASAQRGLLHLVTLFRGEKIAEQG